MKIYFKEKLFSLNPQKFSISWQDFFQTNKTTAFFFFSKPEFPEILFMFFP